MTTATNSRRSPGRLGYRRATVQQSCADCGAGYRKATPKTYCDLCGPKRMWAAIHVSREAGRQVRDTEPEVSQHLAAGCSGRLFCSLKAVAV